MRRLMILGTDVWISSTIQRNIRTWWWLQSTKVVLYFRIVLLNTSGMDAMIFEPTFLVFNDSVLTLHWACIRAACTNDKKIVWNCNPWRSYYFPLRRVCSFTYFDSGFRQVCAVVHNRTFCHFGFHQTSQRRVGDLKIVFPEANKSSQNSGKDLSPEHFTTFSKLIRPPIGPWSWYEPL